MGACRNGVPKWCVKPRLKCPLSTKATRERIIYDSIDAEEGYAVATGNQPRLASGVSIRPRLKPQANTVHRPDAAPPLGQHDT